MEVRNRKPNVDKHKKEKPPESSGVESNDQNLSSSHPAVQRSSEVQGKTIDHYTYSFWLTRVVLLRFIAFIYGVAFLISLTQNQSLIGSKGLLPGNKYLTSIAIRFGESIWNRFGVAPTLFWFIDYSNEATFDAFLHYISMAGLALSCCVVVTGAANMIIMLTLWILYHSLVNIGQRWYSFGWESQLLESGFLAIFLCPVYRLSALPKDCPTPDVVIWGYRWLIFRIMMGAGLIKIRGDRCWRDLTCMNYHYETQPVPNPLSYYLHQTHDTWHQVETAGNHFVELVAPFLLLMPIRRLRLIGGFIQLLFQVVLILSGNLSFLNWLTILPCLACFDDASLMWLFTGGTRHKLSHALTVVKSKGYYIRRVSDVFLAILLAYLSIPVVQNLLSSRQAMNTSFDPLRLVNTYGAFGSITKERTEVILQGTYDEPTDPRAQWLEYEFNCKPGNVHRRPCLVSPYHYRLDWLMWFAAFQSYQHNPWLLHLIAKLFVNDPIADDLILSNPFSSQSPPKYIRAEHYLYTYTKVGSGSKDWWKRERIGSYIPAVSLKDLKPILKQMGWTVKQK